MAKVRNTTRLILGFLRSAQINLFQELMSQFNLSTSATEVVVERVAAMAEFSFGDTILQNSFVRKSLIALVRHLEVLGQSRSRFTIKEVHNSVKRHFKVSYKGKRNPLKMFIDCAFFLVVYLKNLHGADLYFSTARLQQSYPMFLCHCSDEASHLLAFRNCMAVAVRYIRAEKNMDYLMTLCTLLTEGRGKRHVTGSGETRATSDRVIIFRKEGVVPLEPRKARKSDVVSPDPKGEEATRPSRKRSRDMFSVDSDVALKEPRVEELLYLLHGLDGIDTSADVCNDMLDSILAEDTWELDFSLQGIDTL